MKGEPTPIPAEIRHPLRVRAKSLRVFKIHLREIESGILPGGKVEYDRDHRPINSENKLEINDANLETWGSLKSLANKIAKRIEAARDIVLSVEMREMSRVFPASTVKENAKVNVVKLDAALLEANAIARSYSDRFRETEGRRFILMQDRKVISDVTQEPGRTRNPKTGHRW